jgi:hypothetical protein
MDAKKELEDFAVRFGGALLGMEESAATEIYSRKTGQGFGQLITGLAPNDNLLVAGLSLPPWLVGWLLEEDGEKRGDSKAKAQGEGLRKLGEGDAVYSFTLVFHNTLGRIIPNAFPLGAPRVNVNPGGTPTLPGNSQYTQPINVSGAEVKVSDGTSIIARVGNVNVSA